MRFFTEPKYNTIAILAAVLLAFISSYTESQLVHIGNWLVLIYFILEAAFKIRTFSWTGYISSFANKFDFSIVVASILFLVMPGQDTGTVIYLRIFRMISLIRIIRLMPDAEHQLNGLLRALNASKPILILLSIKLVFFSMLGFTLFSGTLPQYFGDPLLAMNTVFGIFTIENWGAVPDAAKALNKPYVFYAVNTFVITVLVLGGFVAVSLANAIFIDEMASDNNDTIKAELKTVKAELSEIKALLIKRDLQVDNRNNPPDNTIKTGIHSSIGVDSSKLVETSELNQ